MYGKKQRIISFLMAFLLIFTFAFINPLTISQSQAFTFAIPALSANMVKIIAGVMASSGIGITAGQALQEVDYESAATAVANVIYRTLNGAEKIALGALSIIDNVVDVPISLYNSIVSHAKSLFVSADTPTLLEQGISTKYYQYNPETVGYPQLSFPVYEGEFTTGTTDVQTYNMTEAIPIFVYDVNSVPGSTSFSADGVTSFIFDFSNEEFPINTNDNFDYVFLSPNIEPYSIETSTSNTNYTAQYVGVRETSSKVQILFYYLSGTSTSLNAPFIEFPKSALNSAFYNYIMKVYWVYNLTNNCLGYVLDFYDFNGNFVKQKVTNYPTNYGVGLDITSTTILESPADVTFNVETTPSSVVTNTDATANVLTLPTTVADTIGLTSSDVNVGTTDVPDVPNTEIMENINTNVGELVTGGTLGEQVNTNIGTVEGLHGELTEQVDFGAVFDTIAQYISSLDISSVTWFPVAVAGFIAPFLPVISLGIILFFIDRVLNGGA